MFLYIPNEVFVEFCPRFCFGFSSFCRRSRVGYYFPSENPGDYIFVGRLYYFGMFILSSCFFEPTIQLASFLNGIFLYILLTAIANPLPFAHCLLFGKTS